MNFFISESTVFILLLSSYFFFSVDNVPQDVTKDSKDDNDSNINKK